MSQAIEIQKLLNDCAFKISVILDRAVSVKYFDADGNEVSVVTSELKPLPNDIIVVVSETLGLDSSYVLGKKHVADYVDARAIISYILRNDYKMYLNSIGKLLYRDHSSICNLLEKISDSEKFNPILYDKLERCQLAVEQYKMNMIKKKFSKKEELSSN